MSGINQSVNSYNASKEILKDKQRGPQEADPILPNKAGGNDISYQARKKPIQTLSPERQDFFAKPGLPSSSATSSQLSQNDQSIHGQSMNKREMTHSYKDIKARQTLQNEKQTIINFQFKQQRQRVKNLYGTGTGVSVVRNDQWQSSSDKSTSSNLSSTTAAQSAKNISIDRSSLQNPSVDSHKSVNLITATPKTANNVSSSSAKWQTVQTKTPLSFGVTPKRNRWDLTPASGNSGLVQRTSSMMDKAGVGGQTPTPRGWNQQTPMRLNNSGGLIMGETPTPGRIGKSRWDQTPVADGGGNKFSATPNNNQSMMYTPSTQQLLSQMTPGQIHQWRIEKQMDQRNKPLTDEELDAILPAQGYTIIEQPVDYKPIRTPARKLLSTPTPMAETPLFYQLPGSSTEEAESKPYNIPMTPQQANDAMPYIKPQDIGAFGALLNEVDQSKLSPQEQMDRKIMLLLLKVKNGSPPMRKQALRTITEKAREFGPAPLFNQILPLLMSPTLQEQERHLLVKVIDRVLYKLDELVRPYVHKILVVIMPMLIDQDYYARVEGRQIISNLAKAAGLSVMIFNMRQDIDHNDEYVRNTTARAFAVVAGALGIPTLLPFLKAVCHSKKSAKARHTGIKIVQQIAILMGCAVLPYLKNLVQIIEHGLKDEQQKIRTITALALSALAEASAPYGIQSFESVLIPLWNGTQQYQGKTLAAFLKAIGFIIPLMDPEHACAYTKEVMHILIPAFKNPQQQMKKIVLKVVKQCVGTQGVEAIYVREYIVPEFFKNYWVRRIAHDHKNAKQLVETTLEISSKIGGADVIGRIVDHLRDDSEPYRKLVMEAVEKIIATLGVADIDSRLEDQLMNGIIYAFQEQVVDDQQVVINGIGTVVNCMGTRVKRYINFLCGTIKWNLKNPSSKVRQNAADLISRVAQVMKTCGQQSLMGQLGVTLYELLGEEYPEVLGSILGGLKAIVNVIGMAKMKPPIKELLPRLTPILKNRHEKVQENCIDLVGRIADRGAEYVSPKEWMRICFDLLDLLKAHKKGIRRATVNTFGYIAKAIGPHDVLATLLNNLRVQERQNRVCTTVAIAIVAETCGPFTVIPALMNEYKVPQMNVQNGVLKSLSFMFQYIGEMGKDYIYAVTPLLQDALMDRDLVHRQTAASAVKHLSLGVAGLSCEDAIAHLLNFIWPNIFQTSPHVINAVLQACEGVRVALGPARILLYVVQGLFHPARRVREVYWKVYNNMYLGAQDALVAAYPMIVNDDNEILGFDNGGDKTKVKADQAKNDYRRYQLELFV